MDYLDYEGLKYYHKKISEEIKTGLDNVQVDLTGYATESWVKEQNYLTEHQDISGKVDIEDLNGYATQQWVEELNYLTEHQDISNKVDISDFEEATKVVSATLNLFHSNTLWQTEDTYVKCDKSKTLEEAVSGESDIVYFTTDSHQIVLNGSVYSVLDLAGYATEQWVTDKLADIATEAEENVQSDWNVTDSSSDAFIKNKPTNLSDFTNDIGFITGVSWGEVTDKPTFATVATSGSYNDLSNKPTIPTVPDYLPNQYSLKFGDKSYNGSSEQTITAADLGLTDLNLYLPLTGGTLTGNLTMSTGSALWFGDGAISGIVHTVDSEQNNILAFSGEKFTFGGTITSPGFVVHQSSDDYVLLGGGGTKLISEIKPTDQQISNWNNAYAWGNHANAGYVKSSGITQLNIGSGLEGRTHDGIITNGITTSVGTISLKTSTSDGIGGIKIGYIRNSQNYPVELNDNGQAFVNVPWTDTIPSLDGYLTSSDASNMYVKKSGDTMTGDLTLSAEKFLKGNVQGYADALKVYSGTVAPNDMSPTEFSMLHNYSETTLWSGQVPENTYGRVIQFGGNGYLTGQLHWTPIIVDGTATTGNLYWRVGDPGRNASNPSEYWEKTQWKQIAFTDSSVAISAPAFYETSDIRKKDIKSDLSLDKCYDLIDKCQTVIYSLKDQTKEQVGMIAQEIEEFFPEVVATDEEGFKSLAYDRLVVICFKVLKDVIKRLEKLENHG